MREMGIRTALGAERSRLVRQLLTESLMISIAGGAGGLLIGMLGSNLLWSFRPPFFTDDTVNVTMDWRVFAFTAAVTLLTGVLFGVMPAFRTSIGNLAETLKAGGRSGNAGLASNRLRSVLVVAEVTLSLVALTGAGLLIRSMQRVEQINPGFETKNLFVFNFDIAPQRLAPERAREFLRIAIERAAAVPGVDAAALASNRPLGGGILATLLPEGQDNDPNRRGTLTTLNSVSPQYFDTMRIPMIEGRGFTDFDRQESKPVAIVNDTMARHFWPGQNAIGKRFRTATNNAYLEVVGICATAVLTTIGEQPQPQAYLPLGQNLSTGVVMHVRTEGNPAGVMPAVLRQVQSLNANMALNNPATIQKVIHDGLWAPRVAASLFGIFGVLGMMLSSIGVYGVMTYMVAQRTNEIGLRMALGARPWDVLRLVVGQGMRLTLAGIAIGIIAGLSATRLMGSLLFGVSTSDPMTFGVVSILVAAVALIAGWLPARRAARIDPVLALRQE
jgi:putative ABC transport system permease protein